MDFLYNNNLINEIVDKLFRHRRNDYSEFHLGKPVMTQTPRSRRRRSRTSSSGSTTSTMNGYRSRCFRVVVAIRASFSRTVTDRTGWSAAIFCGRCGRRLPSARLTSPGAVRARGTS